MSIWDVQVSWNVCVCCFQKHAKNMWPYNVRFYSSLLSFTFDFTTFYVSLLFLNRYQDLMRLRSPSAGTRSLAIGGCWGAGLRLPQILDAGHMGVLCVIKLCATWPSRIDLCCNRGWHDSSIPDLEASARTAFDLLVWRQILLFEMWARIYNFVLTQRLSKFYIHYPSTCHAKLPSPRCYFIRIIPKQCTKSTSVNKQHDLFKD